MGDLQIFEIVVACIASHGVMMGVTYHLYYQHTSLGDSEGTCKAVAFIWPITTPIFLGLIVGQVIDWAIGNIKRLSEQIITRQELKNRTLLAEVAAKEAEIRKILVQVDRELQIGAKK